MNINDQNKRVRSRLLFLPILAIFLSYILFKFLLPDYYVREKDLVTDSAIIQDVFKNKYLSYEKFRGRVYKSCIDIRLVNKPYFIRLSDHLVDEYWPVINDSVNILKPIEIKYQPRLLHAHMLINPNQIAIDNKIIISYNAKKSFIGWFAVAILLIIIACLYFIYLSFKTYKKNLYLYDKEIGSKSKWQLFLVWLKD